MNYVPLQHVKQRLNVKPWAGKAFNEAATKRPLLSSFTCLTPHLLQARSSPAAGSGRDAPQRAPGYSGRLSERKHDTALRGPPPTGPSLGPAGSLPSRFSVRKHGASQL